MEICGQSHVPAALSHDYSFMTYIRRLSLSENIHRRCWDSWGIVTGKGFGRKLQGTNLDKIQEFAVRTDENHGIVTLACVEAENESQIFPIEVNCFNVKPTCPMLEV